MGLMPRSTTKYLTEEEVYRLTDSVRVDHVVEVGGAGTLENQLEQSVDETSLACYQLGQRI